MVRKATSTEPSNVASALITCPVCSKQVPLAVINVHLDISCGQGGLSYSQHQPKRTQSKSPIISIQIHDGKQHSPKRRKLETHDQDKPQRAASSILEVQAKQAHLLQRPDHTEYIEAASLTPAATDKSITNGLRNSIDTAALDTHEEVRDPALPQVMGNLPSERMHTADGRTAKNPSNLFQRMKSAANNKLPGQFLLENFITEDEERELIDYIDTCEPPWHLSTFNGPHGGKAWGVRMDLQKRTVLAPKHPMPDLLMQLAERMQGWAPLKDFHPSEANANDYLPSKGMYLGPHVDDRQLSTGAIVTLSLVDAAVMTFQREKLGKSAAKIRVKLPPRSLQALTGESRYSFTHAIAKEDFQGCRRLSITFRQSPLKLV